MYITVLTLPDRLLTKYVNLFGGDIYDGWTPLHAACR
jgi:hypothetical protein